MTGTLILSKAPPTSGSTVSAYVELVARPRLCDGELVVLSVGSLPVVSQVNAQLVVGRVGHLMEVGQTCGEITIRERERERERERDRATERDRERETERDTKKIKVSIVFFIFLLIVQTELQS